MKYFSIFLLLFFVTVCEAQTPDYCVYLLSGSATVKSGNKKPVKLSANQVVYNDQSIVLGKNSKITLVNKAADYLVLSKPGEYKVINLHKDITKQPPGVTKKYFTVLWNELVKPSSSYDNLIKTTKGGVMGGVTRGNRNCTSILFPPAELKTAADSVTVIWTRVEKEEEYLFILSDAGGTELIRQPVKDTQLVVNTQTLPGDRVGRYYFSVSGKQTGACEDEASVIEIVNKEEENKLRAGYKTIAESNKEQTVQLDFIDRIVNENRIILAAEIYKKLVQKNSANANLGKSYLLFLTNYGFTKEATALSKILF